MLALAVRHKKHGKKLLEAVGPLSSHRPLCPPEARQ